MLVWPLLPRCAEIEFVTLRSSSEYCAYRCLICSMLPIRFPRQVIQNIVLGGKLGVILLVKLNLTLYLLGDILLSADFVIYMIPFPLQQTLSAVRLNSTYFSGFCWSL